MSAWARSASERATVPDDETSRPLSQKLLVPLVALVC